ncbi:MAG: hypothetical protein ACJ71W_21730 [Terriglobales bacterium]
MSKKGAPTPINEVTPANTVTATEPAEHPTLTETQKVQILTLQRNAVVTQNQKFQADQAFEKAMAELNRAYQTVNNQQGFSLNENTLDFVSTQG